MIAALWFCAKNSPESQLQAGKNDVLVLVSALVLIIIWVLLSGIGKVMYQNPDHTVRNGIFEMLIAHEWPIKGYIPTDSGIKARGLIYYIGFWMPASLVGKLLGVNAGYVFQIIWAVLGIFLLYLMICEKTGRLSLLPLVILIFFCNMRS